LSTGELQLSVDRCFSYRSRLWCKTVRSTAQRQYERYQEGQAARFSHRYSQCRHDCPTRTESSDAKSAVNPEKHQSDTPTRLPTGFLASCRIMFLTGAATCYFAVCERSSLSDGTQLKYLRRPIFAYICP
jgi:hypothetical protein